MDSQFSESTVNPVNGELQFTSLSVDDNFLVDVLYEHKDGSGFETRMEFPEKTHLQEVLEQPIPLSYRVAHLIPYIEPTSETHTATSIADAIGSNAKWVENASKKVGIQTTTKTINGEECRIYPYLSLELLAEEWRWYQAYKLLDEELSETAVAEFVAMDRKTVRQIANELEVFPQYKTIGHGLTRTAYPKDFIPKLRHIVLSVPPSENRFTVNELAQQTGQDWEWVKRQLQKSKYTPELRRSMTDSRTLEYYDVESLAYINELVAARPRPAAEWATITSIAKMVGKDREWIAARIKEAFVETGEVRRDDSGKSAMHYPPAVIEVLKETAEQLSNYPDAGEYLALNALAKRVGRDAKWVLKRLPFIEAQSEKRLNQNQQIYDYFPQNAVAQLLELPSDILKKRSSS